MLRPEPIRRVWQQHLTGHRNETYAALARAHVPGLASSMGVLTLGQLPVVEDQRQGRAVAVPIHMSSGGASGCSSTARCWIRDTPSTCSTGTSALRRRRCPRPSRCRTGPGRFGWPPPSSPHRAAPAVSTCRCGPLCVGGRRFLQRAAAHLASLGRPVRGAPFATVADLLAATNAAILDRGSEPASIPAQSIDFVFSQAVLEHVALGEFDATLTALHDPEARLGL